MLVPDDDKLVCLGYEDSFTKQTFYYLKITQ